MNAPSHRWRAAGTVIAITALLLVVASVPSFAADNSGSSGGLLDPLNVKTSEGATLDHYELTGHGDDSVTGTVLNFLTSGTFAISRTITGFACWLVDWAYKFPVLDKLTGPAQTVADSYQRQIIGPLGIAGLFTTWAFVFGLIMIMRGRSARGAGEILLTLLIAALAATTTVRPAMLLGYNGPVQQTQRAALEAADITANGSDTSKANDPCNLITGPAQDACRKSAETTSPKDEAKQRKQQCAVIQGPAKDACLSGTRYLTSAAVSGPITRTLTDTLVVQPYMLLEYGEVIDKDSPLYKVHKVILTRSWETASPEVVKTCSLIDGEAKKYCLKSGKQSAPPEQQFSKLGDEGKAVSDYMSKPTWSRFIGAVAVLIATLILCLVVISMVLALFAAQFGCVIAAVCAGAVLAWSLLPGPNRAVLWKWLGTFASAAVVLFGIAVFIPAFGIAARAMLADSQTPLLERLVTLDGLAVTALAGHRVMLRKGRDLGQRIADRMRYARIGGSTTMDSNAAATAAALSSLNYGGTGGGSGAHLSFMNRHAGLASSLRSLGDSTGLVGHPGAFLAEAGAEGRRALAPVALGLRTAHAALIGPKRPRQEITPVGPDGRPLPRLIDGRTGRVIDNSDQGVIPYGARLEAGLRRTRGGRILVRASKLGYYSTVGLPATWTRARRATSELSTELNQEFGRQSAHYRRAAAEWRTDTREGVHEATTPVRRGYQAVAGPIQRANRMRTWQQTWLDEHGRPRYQAAPPRPGTPDPGEGA
ncbi:hypothetical protein ACH4UM_37875 [Streptomyces sp. NPDC020801]|uniref:hypothetical protein n=1 Tax=Streptomyces sp. NPDC020801 TaxID=3365093 RepID=UPI003798EE48